MNVMRTWLKCDCACARFLQRLANKFASWNRKTASLLQSDANAVGSLAEGQVMPLELFRQPVNDHNKRSLQAQIDAPNEFMDIVGWMALEPRYVDADFRDLYYRHLAGKHREWRRDCQRLHLWDTKGQYLGAIVFSWNPYGEERQWDPFKYDLTPRWLVNSPEKWYLLSAERQIHVFDEAINLHRFPSIAQDGEYTRCAHAALWNVLTFLADKYHIYKSRLPTEIQELSARQTVQRSFPSAGLITEEMSSVLLSCGIYPRIYHASSAEETRGAFDLLDILDVYLDSGFPILTSIDKHNEDFFAEKPGRSRWNIRPEGGEGHAVVIVGHNCTLTATYAPGRPALAYRHRSAYLVVDDNGFPYTTMHLVPNGEDRARIAYGCDDKGGPRFNCVMDIIIPLPRRIGIFAEHILAFLPFLMDSAPITCRMVNPDLNDLVFRPFLMSAGGYRQRLLKTYGPVIAKMDATYLRVIGAMPLPHFVWVIEVASRKALENPSAEPGKLSYGHIVLDASGQGLAADDDSYERFLLLWNLGRAWIAFKSTGEEYEHTWTPSPEIQSRPSFPFMCHNLRTADSSDFKHPGDDET